jgi:hypothetical protein
MQIRQSLPEQCTGLILGALLLPANSLANNPS